MIRHARGWCRGIGLVLAVLSYAPAVAAFEDGDATPPKGEPPPFEPGSEDAEGEAGGPHGEADGADPADLVLDPGDRGAEGDASEGDPKEPDTQEGAAPADGPPAAGQGPGAKHGDDDPAGDDGMAVPPVPEDGSSPDGQGGDDGTPMSLPGHEAAPTPDDGAPRPWWCPSGLPSDPDPFGLPGAGSGCQAPVGIGAPSDPWDQDRPPPGPEDAADEPEERLDDWEPEGEAGPIGDPYGDQEPGGRPPAACEPDKGGDEGTLLRIVRDVGGLDAQECFVWTPELDLFEHQDWAGNRTTLNWDAAGRLVGVTDAEGGRTSLRYGERGRLEHSERDVTDARWFDGRESGTIRRRHVYDSVGNVSRVDAQLGEEVLQSLHARTSPDQRLGAIGRVGGSALCVHERDEERRPTALRLSGFDPNSGLCESELGQVGIEYDPVTGEVVAVSDPLGRSTRVLERTPAGRIGRLALPDGGVVDLGYTVLGRLARIVVASSEEAGAMALYREQREYDDMGHLVRLVETVVPSGGWPPEELGQLETREQLLDHIAETPGFRSLIVRRSNPGGGLTTELRSWDALGRPYRVTTPEQPETTYAYRANLSGHRETVSVEGYDVPTVYRYDRVGRLVRVYEPWGWEEHYGYDSRGVPTTLHVNGRLRKTYSSDGLGRIRTVERYLDPVVEEAELDLAMDYGAGGNLTALRRDGHEQGWRYEYEFGQAGLLSRIVDPVGGVTDLSSYDPAGRPELLDDARGTEIELAHDAAGRLRSVDLRAGDGWGTFLPAGDWALARQRFEYDPLGHLRWAGESYGERVPATDAARPCEPDWTTPDLARYVDVLREPDSLGRLGKETTDLDGCRLATTCHPDVLDNPEHCSYSGGLLVSYAYTPAGNLERVTVASVDAPEEVLWDAAYVFDVDLGRHEAAELPDGSVLGYAYDAFGRLTGWDRSDALGLVDAEHLRVDPSGNVVARGREARDVPEGTEHLRALHDADGRLVAYHPISAEDFAVVDASQWSPVGNAECAGSCRGFALGPRGNRLVHKAGDVVRAYEVAADDALVSMVEHHGCDSMWLDGEFACGEPGGEFVLGNPEEDLVDFEYDGMGNLVSIRRGGQELVALAYDGFNRLRRAYLPADPPQPETPAWQVLYDYDALDRLVRRRVFAWSQDWDAMARAAAQAIGVGQEAPAGAGGEATGDLGLPDAQPGEAGDRWAFEQGQRFVWFGTRLMEVHWFEAEPDRPVEEPVAVTSYVYGLGSGPAASFDTVYGVRTHVRALDGSLLALRMEDGQAHAWYRYTPHGEVTVRRLGGQGPERLEDQRDERLLYRGMWRDDPGGSQSREAGVSSRGR